jgi:acetyltransferase-like isoleucine patch superfamily enzyme
MSEMATKVRWLLNHVRNFLYFRLRYPWVKTGSNVHVQWGTRMWSPNKHIVLGDSVGIGPGCVINTDVEIGNHVMLAAHVGLISKDAHTFGEPGISMFESPRGDQFKIVIEDDVWLGFGSIVLSGVTIGRGSIIGAGAIVTKDVLPYSIVLGKAGQIAGMRFTEKQIADHESILRSRGIIK